MYKTYDWRTAENFGKKKGNRVIQRQFGEWLLFEPGEKIPEKLLQAEEERTRPKRKYTRRKQLTLKKAIKRKVKLMKRPGRPRKVK